MITPVMLESVEEETTYFLDKTKEYRLRLEQSDGTHIMINGCDEAEVFKNAFTNLVFALGRLRLHGKSDFFYKLKKKLRIF